MNCENFLTELSKFGENHFDFELDEIGKIHDSCCEQSTTKVYNFDKVKSFFCTKNAVTALSSCDCLKILPSKKNIDFIELKDCRKFSLTLTNEKKRKKTIESLTNKIQDSLHILYSMIIDSKFSSVPRLKAKHFIRNEVTINYIIVTNTDVKSNAFLSFATSLAYLSLPALSEIKTNFIDKISTNSALNLQKPELKSCSEIDLHYKS